MKKRTTYIILSIICAVLILLMVLSSFADRIKMNDETVVGNTAGNLNNNGLFCEKDGIVYFSNAYDSGTLYSMNTDETDFKKLSKAQVKYINIAGKYLYYYQTNSTGVSQMSFANNINGLYRTNLKGSNAKCLSRDASLTMTLVGNYIYYQRYDNKLGTVLHKIKIDKSDSQPLSDYVINPASVQDQTIYYNGTQKDHNLYALDTRTDSISRVWDGDIWNPIVQEDYVYYMDVANNYRLCRYSFSQETIDVLSSDRLEFFNLYDNYIYYQTNSETEPALKRINTDGSNDEVVAEGVYQNINITSSNVYFNRFDMPTPVYKQSTFGSVNVTTFDAAATAALEAAK